MKRIRIALLCTGMMLLVGGCQLKEPDSPQIVTTGFLDACNKLDSEKIKEYSQWSDYNQKALIVQESDYVDGVDRSLQKQVYEMMRTFDHKEGEESIKDENATVKTTLTLYDFEPTVKAGLIEATKKAQELSENPTISDADAQAEIQTIIFENMKNAKKTLKKEIEIKLIKKEDQWFVSKDNTELQKIMIDNIQSLQNISL